MDRELTRNEAFVLGIIDDIGPCTGYDIVFEGENRGRELGIPSVYEAINPMWKAGLVTREERSISSRKTRWHWRTTEEGKTVRAEQPEEESSTSGQLTPQPAT